MPSGSVAIAAHLARAVVRVRLHRQHVDVHRQDVRVGDRVVARRRRGCRCSGAPDAASPACASARSVAEIQADRRLHELRLAARLHVQLDDEIGVRLEAPREILRQQRRHLTRRPAEEMAVGILRRVRDQAVVARARICLVETTRGGGPIDADVGVVDDAGVARPELQPAHEARAVDGHRQDEDVKDVGAFRRQRVRLRQRDDEVGLAELPAFRPRARGGQVARIALLGSFVDPLLDQLDLGAVSGCCPTNGPSAGSAFHGGMNRFRVTSAICGARRLTSV